MLAVSDFIGVDQRVPARKLAQVMIFDRDSWRSIGRIELVEINEELLVELAGRGAFERGAVYFEEGRVSDVETKEYNTNAVVHSSHPYTVTLRRTNRNLEGACNCPASNGFDFCKHCVALALTLQAMPADAVKSDKKGADSTIRDYLCQQSKNSLIKEIMGNAKQHPALRESMLQRAQLSSGKPTYAKLKKIITRVTPARHLWGYPEVGEYFQGLQSTLDRIASVADEIEPQVLLRTVEYGIVRLERALETVDDSGGFRFGSQNILGQLQINALRRLNWPPSKLAGYFVELILAERWELLSESAENYDEIMDDAALEAFFLEIESRLNALPKLPVGAEFDQKYPYIRLSRFLESQAREAGDIDGLIRIKQRIATSARDYYEIARLFLDQHDTATAAEWLNKADSITQHDHEHDLKLWVDLHVARQEWVKAARVQQTIFQKRHDYSDYRKLLQLAARTGQEDRVREDVKTLLLEQLELHSGALGNQAFALAQILRDEEDWQGAFETLVHHIAHQDRFETAAAWFVDSRPDYACELYQRAIESEIGRKNKTGYNAAADLVVSVKPVFEKLPGDAYSELVTRLRRAHRQKRNFLAALDAHGL